MNTIIITTREELLLIPITGIFLLTTGILRSMEGRREKLILNVLLRDQLIRFSMRWEAYWVWQSWTSGHTPLILMKRQELICREKLQVLCHHLSGNKK